MLQSSNSWKNIRLYFCDESTSVIYELKSREPEQAKSIPKRIQEGREFTGGLEVEADTQIYWRGLVRSLIYGQERIENVRGQKK